MVVRFIAISVCAWFCISRCAAEPGQFPKDPVKVSARAKKADEQGKQVITLTFQIAKNCWIYANPVDCDLMKHAETTVTVKGVPSNCVEVRYPAGRRVEMRHLGESYRVYEGVIEIPITVRRTEATEPIEIVVHFYPGGHCYLPKTFRFRLP